MNNAQVLDTASYYNLMSPLLSEKAVEEAVRNCEQLKQREQEEDIVVLGKLEKQRVEALEVLEKEREIVEQERAVYESIADKISKS